MQAEILSWILGGATAVVSCFVAALWQIVREEARAQNEKIERKANAEVVTEVERRCKSEIDSVRESNEKLINKLEQRHEKEMSALTDRLTDQMKTMEVNILRHIETVFSRQSPHS